MKKTFRIKKNEDIEKIIKGIKYRLNEETMTAEVIAKRNGYEGDIIIPETVVSNRASYLVTSIGKNAFFDCKSLTSITLPNSVKSIGIGSFTYCESLTSITIPDSVKVIADMAFFHCESLTEITIPNSVKSLGYEVFKNCISLEAITYNGTRDKWKKVKKDTLSDKWITGILAKFVQCTDGLVKI